MGLPSSYLHLSAHATLSDPGNLSQNQVHFGFFCWLPTFRRRRPLLQMVTRLNGFTSGATLITAYAVPCVRLHHVIRFSSSFIMPTLGMSG
jgi:hypothetical protein